MRGQSSVVRSRLAVGWLTILVLLSACGVGGEQVDDPDRLAFDDENPASEPGVTSSTTTRPQSQPAERTRFAAPPIPLGSPGQPFVPLASEPTVRAVRTPADIVLPVLGERPETWMVMTACENIAYLPKSAVSVVERAHVVLDPGHGGTEVGAVGPAGTVEKDLNLLVALEASRLLSNQGADVVVTRSTDHNLTTGFRGLLAKSLEPALFVSVHHNGGAPRTGSEPGTIVLTKAESPQSRRFGGLFYQTLNGTLQSAANRRRQAHADYLARLHAYEAEVDAYDQSVQARDAALLANGQITETTVPAPAPEPVDGLVFPRQRNPIPTTTVPPPTVPPPTVVPADGAPGDTTTAAGPKEDDRTSPHATVVPKTLSTVVVPGTLPVPEPFTETPVREFLFAGGGNRGVRSWIRADGKDYLSVLRHSGDVPAALAEFLYVTNPSEEELLMDPEFIAAEAAALADAIVTHFSSAQARGSGFVDDDRDDQPIGGGGRPSDCVEPDYGLNRR